MTTDLLPPPEAQLIRQLREAPPKMSKRQAAHAAGMSEAWWRSLENGYKHFRGTPYPERGNAQAIAKMARAVGATPQQLVAAGREDAAAELVAMLAEGLDLADSPKLTDAQRRLLNEQLYRDVPDNASRPLVTIW